MKRSQHVEVMTLGQNLQTTILEQHHSPFFVTKIVESVHYFHSRMCSCDGDEAMAVRADMVAERILKVSIIPRVNVTKTVLHILNLVDSD